MSKIDGYIFTLDDTMRVVDHDEDCVEIIVNRGGIDYLVHLAVEDISALAQHVGITTGQYSQ